MGEIKLVALPAAPVSYEGSMMSAIPMLLGSSVTIPLAMSGGTSMSSYSDSSRTSMATYSDAAAAGSVMGSVSSTVIPTATITDVVPSASIPNVTAGSGAVSTTSATMPPAAAPKVSKVPAWVMPVVIVVVVLVAGYFLYQNFKGKKK
jgi:hypothetical protein